MMQHMLVFGSSLVSAMTVPTQEAASLLSGDRLLDGTRNFPWLNLASNFAPDLSVYHSTDKVAEVVKGFSSSCASYMTYAEDSGVQILDFNVLPAAAGKEKTKLFFNFGIHGREYITSEVALKLVEKLCDGSERSKNILAANEIKMIPLLNIPGRKKVESGAACESQRKNGNDVDLNRNFNFMWEKGSGQASAEDYHGPSAMSEMEAQLLDKIVTAYAPKVFVDVHSGDTTMMHPWSYKTTKFENSGKYAYTGDMEAMLKFVNEKQFHNKVRTGTASLTLSPPYTAMGTTLDFFYDTKQIPYAFTFEVFAGPRAQQMAGAINLMAGTPDAAHAMDAVVPIHFANRDNGTTTASPSNDHTSNQVNLMKRDNGTIAAGAVNLVNAAPASMGLNDCFAYFNPTNKEALDQTADAWSGSMLYVAEFMMQSKKE